MSKNTETAREIFISPTLAVKVNKLRRCYNKRGYITLYPSDSNRAVAKVSDEDEAVRFALKWYNVEDPAQIVWGNSIYPRTKAAE